MNKKDILYRYQFGFRKNHSTLALIEIIDSIPNATDKGLYTCGIFIDFSKAFDTINHTIVLSSWITMVFVALRYIGFSFTSVIVISQKYYPMPTDGLRAPDTRHVYV